MEQKVIRRRRSECSWKKNYPMATNNTASKNNDVMIEYPPGPIHIQPSWNPVNRADKPPYSYATIIGHAILTSRDRKLTLNDIYIWITANYPFYSNDTQGWQNSIRHNLSLHKAFVKIDRDSTSQNPPRKGCFWTIRPGKEKSFIDNLQKAVSNTSSNSIRKQQSLGHLSIKISKNSTRRASSSTSSTSALLSDFINNDSSHFRTTHDVPESEPIVVTSSSSSSDHNQSPISYSNNSPSPVTYQQNATFNVYPDMNDDLQSYTYSSASNTSNSYFGDTYSTTSSSYNNDYYGHNTTNRLYHNQSTGQLLYKGFSGYNNSLMDYNTTKQQQQQEQDGLLYASTPQPTSHYYYLQHPQQQSAANNIGDFNSFLHR